MAALACQVGTFRPSGGERGFRETPTSTSSRTFKTDRWSPSLFAAMIMSAFNAPQSTSGTPKLGPSVGSGAAPPGAAFDADVEGVSSGMARLALESALKTLTKNVVLFFIRYCDRDRLIVRRRKQTTRFLGIAQSAKPRPRWLLARGSSLF